MIEVISGLIGLAVSLLSVDLTVLGFSFSLWRVMIYLLIAGIIIDLIWGFLDGR